MVAEVVVVVPVMVVTVVVVAVLVVVVAVVDVVVHELQSTGHRSNRLSMPTTVASFVQKDTGRAAQSLGSGSPLQRPVVMVVPVLVLVAVVAVIVVRGQRPHRSTHSLRTCFVNSGRPVLPASQSSSVS
jgi:hypothetical protein